MDNALLILNAGSSSLKFSVFRDSDPPEIIVRGQIEALQSSPRFAARDAHGNVISEHAWPEASTLHHDDAIEFILDWGRRQYKDEFRLTAAGHRVVHGGTKFTSPVVIDENVLSDLEALVPLAPLHQPHNLTAIRAVSKHAPTLPQVACFDTAFHRTQPAVAQRFALPSELTESGIVRYGFHGLSYEYIASRLRQLDPRAANGRTVVAHLGNGASLCAMKVGVSIATTMGFTPLDGLPMGTRCGAIDPGVLIYLLEDRRLSVSDLEHLLTHESGLLGMSGVSGDMRTLLDLEKKNKRVADAIEFFVYRVSREIGSLAAALGGLDALVFSGGIGEHAPSIRERVCQAAAWLGIELAHNPHSVNESKISRDTSRVAVWVVPTNEELMIAHHVRNLL
jgi:acetate kinase